MNTRNTKWLMIAVGLGMLLNPLNSSMVAVAIPRLQQSFHLDFTVVSWIIFTFYIASAVSNPIAGNASDLFGSKRIFLAGLLIAFAASLLAPLSPTFGWLIVFRIVQSIGTSMMISVGMAIIRLHCKENQATVLSGLTVFQSGAAAIGPFLGGILIHWWDWPAIFAANIPFAAASFLLAWRMIPKDERPVSAARSARLIRMDVPGILLFSAGLITLLAGLLSAKSTGHISFLNVLAAGIGLVLLAVFVRHEFRTASPFIPLRTLAGNPAVTWVNIEFMIVNVLFYAVFFGLPSYLQTVRHFSELHTGMLMLTLGMCSLAASPIAGRWVDQSGPKPALRLAGILMIAGSAGIVALGPVSPVIGVCLPLAAFGISNGLNSVGLQAALFQSAPREITGVASGLFSTSRNLGAILSSLLIGIVMGGAFSFQGFRVLGFILTALSLSLVFISRRRRQSSCHV